MVHKGDLRVRNDVGGEEGMCGIAEGTLYPADHQVHFTQRCFDRTNIVSVPYKAAGAAAGAFHLAVVYRIHDSIIKILRNFIAFLYNYCYHIFVCGGLLRHGIGKAGI